MKFYAVRRGRTPGVYTTWPACETQVKGFPNALYKSFPTKAAATAFLTGARATATRARATATGAEKDSLDSRISGNDGGGGGGARAAATAARATATAGRTTRHMPNVVHVWVDGACIQNGDEPLRFGWACVILDGEREIHRANGHDVPVAARRHRNVAAEIQAVLRALTWCKTHGIAAATIYYDYQGLASWVRGAWKTGTPFTRAYVEKVRAFGMTLIWQKVRAHSGEPYNDLVDQLAKDAARSVKGGQRVKAGKGKEQGTGKEQRGR